MSASDFPPSQFPPPLLAKLESPLDRAILSAASADGPSAESKEALLRTLGALGAFGAAGAATAVTTSATSATTATGATTVGVAAKSTIVLTATKVAIGIAVVTAAAGGTWSIREARAPKPAVQNGQMAQAVETSRPAAPAIAPASPGSASVPAAEAPAEAPAAAAPAIVNHPRAVATATPAASAAPVKTDDLAQEAAALATVRTALGRGDVAAANRGLDAYAAAYPNGQLQPEATILRARVAKKIAPE